MSGLSKKEQVKYMMLDGKTNDEIEQLTGLDHATVGRQRGWFNGMNGKAWRAQELSRRSAGKSSEDTASQPQKPPPTVQEERAPPEIAGMGSLGNGGTDHLREPDGRTSSVLSSELERQLLVMGDPLIRKVVLNTKIYFWYDFARAKMAFKGDIGDFVFDCVEDFFASRNYEIIVQKREVTQVR